MNITTLTRSAQHFLCERIERLRQALLHLGQRLREAITHLLGCHVGEAVQDALASALSLPSSSRLPAYHSAWEAGEHYQEFLDNDSSDQNALSDRDPAWPQPRSTSPPRHSLLHIVGVGAVVGFTLLLAGPLLGGIVALAGMAYLLRPLASILTQAAAG